MLLRNYYSSLTTSALGTGSYISEDVSQDLSPRYSRNYRGDYVLAQFPAWLLDLSVNPTFLFGQSSYPRALRVVNFGNNTTDVTFNDYGATGTSTQLSDIRTDYKTTYDENTKTYTSIETFTLTNNTENVLEINEILLGGCGFETSTNGRGAQIYVTRNLLGENAFTMSARESVKFELTIKYTIAEPLQ